MKWRKLLSLALVTVMSASLLAACGGKKAEEPAKKSEAKVEEKKSEAPVEEKKEEAPAEEAPVDLVFWTYPVGGFGDSAKVDGLLANFNAKYPNINVKVEYLDYQSGDDQINTAIEGGNAPDIVLEGPERLVANWGAKGYMVDLSELFDADADDIYPSIVSACKSPDGKAYEYPLCMIAHCMAINKTVFEKADAMQYIDEATHTWTTENFFKAVDAVHKSGQENVGAVYCAGQGGDQGTRALINNLYGGTFTNAEHTAYTLDSAENAKALEALKNQAGINFDASIVGGDEIKNFVNGTFSMAFCWNAAIHNNPDNKNVNGDEILPMLFPSPDGKARLAGGIWGFGIFNNGDEAKIAAAKKFVDFMANDPEQVKAAVKVAGFFPVHKNVTGVYDGEPTADVMNMFTEHFMPSMGDYYQVTPGWAEVRTEWWNMLQRVGSGGDIAAELKVANDTANAAASK